jgi:PAS domain S-box-containing protein
MGIASQRSSKPVAKMSAEAMQLALDESRARIEDLELQNEHLRHTESTLRAQTGYLEELCDLMPIGYLRLSQKGLILDANRAAVQLLGAYRTKLRMRSLTRFVCDDQKAAYQQFHDTVRATEIVNTCEVKLKSQRGQEFWARLTSACAPVPDKGLVPDVESEHTRDLIVMINDITVSSPTVAF